MDLKTVYAGMKKFLETFTDCPSASIVQGWQNRMAIPKLPFIVMSIIDEQIRSTNVHDYDTTNQKTTTSRGVVVRMQIDLYGDKAYEWGTAVGVMIRDARGCDVLKSYGVSPVHPREPKCLPAVFSENQYTPRWFVEVYLNYDESVVVAEQSFVEATFDTSNIHILT